MMHFRPDDPRLDLCRKLVVTRKMVDKSLGALCPSPIWDMLLELYVAHHEDRPVYLWSLCQAANIPVTTARRKVSDMEDAGLLTRMLADVDKRCVGVTISAHGERMTSALLDRFLQIWRQDMSMDTNASLRGSPSD